MRVEWQYQTEDGKWFDYRSLVVATLPEALQVISEAVAEEPSAFYEGQRLVIPLRVIQPEPARVVTLEG